MNQLELKKVRQQLGLSHKGLAEKLGLDRSTVSHWEGGRPISIRKLLDLALKQLSNEMDITSQNKIG